MIIESIGNKFTAQFFRGTHLKQFPKNILLSWPAGSLNHGYEIPYLGRGLIIDAGGIAGLDELVVQLQGADYPWHAEHQNTLEESIDLFFYIKLIIIFVK